MKLNGSWTLGGAEVTVSGLHCNSTRIEGSPITYSRTLKCPVGNWNRARLLLMGARFCPTVLVNGEEVAHGEGGMAPIELDLDHPAIQPGAEVELSIRLLPLGDVPDSDASCIPPADRWRSNCAPCLWDEVHLHIHRDVNLKGVLPFQNGGDELKVRAQVENLQGGERYRLTLGPLNQEGEAQADLDINLPLDGLGFWSPERP